MTEHRYRRPFPLAPLALVLLGTLPFAACGSDTETSGAEQAQSTAVSTTSPASTPSSTTAPGTSSNPEVIAAAVTAAEGFLATLDDAQRRTAVLRFDDLAGKQGSWSNLPVPIFQGRQGVRFGDIDETQRSAALGVLDAVLSDQGMTQLNGILAAEAYLGGLGNSGLGWTEDNYWVAFYGTPATDSPWTLQFGGHHFAIHLTLGGGVVSASPMFTGVEPTTFTHDGKQYAPMVAEAEAAIDLLQSLDAQQAPAAKLSGVFDDVLVGPGEDGTFPPTEGTLITDLTAEQQDRVREFIGLWVADAAPAIAQGLMDTYEQQFAETRLSWSGAADPTAAGTYLRIDGPRLWLEYSQVPGIGTSEIHYHSIYRDKLADYGASD